MHSTSHYVISILDLQNSEEVRRIAVDEPISRIGWAGNILLVGTRSNIHGYSMSNLLNSVFFNRF